MRKKQHKIAILILFCLGMLVSVPILNSKSITNTFIQLDFTAIETSIGPYPTVSHLQSGTFPTSPLMCPRDMMVAEGPSWRGITIGKSLLNDLEEIYGVRFTRNLLSSDKDSGLSYYVTLTSKASQERKLSGYAETCLVNGKIIALMLAVGKDSELPSGWLGEWIQQLGEPQIVTWAGNNDWGWRLLIWPKKGIALLADVRSINQDPSAVLIDSVVLFPFATDSISLSRWPFTKLVKTPPTANNIDGSPTAENPFMFDIIKATTTIQFDSSPTSTP
jgi:hypothetical protein